MKIYTIRHDPVREGKGLKSWGVFEQVGPDFTQGVSQHQTMQEALAAKAFLERRNGKENSGTADL